MKIKPRPTDEHPLRAKVEYDSGHAFFFNIKDAKKFLKHDYDVIVKAAKKYLKWAKKQNK